MIQSDLTTKLIEKFRTALNEINELLNEKKYNDALDVINNALSEMFRLNLKSFNSLSDEYLIEIIKINGILEADRCIIVSVLLEKEGDILQIQGNLNESHYIYTKCLNIFLEGYLINNTPELEEFYAEIPTLINSIAEYKLSERTGLKLIRYYEDLCNFAKSEDIIFDLIENAENTETIRKEALGFYERILKNDDTFIEQGGLTREEIYDALQELKST